jgi:hypothetical protein
MRETFRHPEGDEPRDPTELAVRLARLYPSAVDTLDVLRRAGVDVGEVRLDNRPETSLRIWKGAVAIADSHDRLDVLLGVAREHYGRRKVASIQELTPSNYLFIMPLLLAGVALFVALSIAWMMLTVPNDTWRRIDAMPKDFRDIVIAARNAKVHVNPYDVVWHRETPPLLDPAVIALVWGRGDAPAPPVAPQRSLEALAGQALAAVGARQTHVERPNLAPRARTATINRVTAHTQRGGIPPFLPDAIPMTELLATPVQLPALERADASGWGLARSEELR